MKVIDLLVGFNSVKDSYVISAEEFRHGKRKRLSTRKMWLIAAVIALTLLLVGCAVAYANGWFQQIFSARSETPLSSEQIQYIQNNEQIVGQSQTKKDWTVDLKSTICDGRTVSVKPPRGLNRGSGHETISQNANISRAV